jgi:hypothetical protein
MFDTKKSAATHVADAADLVIDFATLGEYGLEPVATGRPCEARHRPRALRSTGTWNAAIARFATSA